MDALSVKRIALLHPVLRKSATQILAEIEAALTGRATCRYTYTLRTASEQADLYALGRTVKNPDGVSKQRPLGYKVTNAPAWSSMHNFGLAVDIALILDGKTASWNELPDYDGDRISDWMECVAIFKRHGWTWGGDWSSLIDKPHFQCTFGLTLMQLQAKRLNGDFLPGTTYVDLNNPAHPETEAIADVNLRSGPSTTYAVVQIIPKGTRLSVIDRGPYWSQVELGKLTGWVSNQYIK